MKRITILYGLVAAFLCLAQQANAQYLTTEIHREKAHFINNRGMVLSDQELVGLIGEDVFYDTVVGARKQYKAGRTLVISGGIGFGVGVAGVLGGVAMITAAEPRETSQGQVYFNDEDLAAAGGASMILGSIVMSLGAVALTVGIPLKAIGQSRLNWVENDYNERSRGYSLHVGSAPGGVGVSLTF